MDIAKKRQDEKRVMTMMVRLYCHGKRHPTSAADICPQCAALLSYANSRTDRCPRMAEKTFCSKCPAPCYEPARREEIRRMMRYAAPRLLLRHPIPVLRHMLAPKQKKAAAVKEADS